MTGFISKAINVLFGLMMLLILVISFFGAGAEYAYKTVFQLPNPVYALLGVLCFLVIGFIVHFAGRILEKCRFATVIMLGLNICLFFFLILLTYHYYFKTGWDAQVVEGTSRMIAINDWESVQTKYFSYYPNNVFITFVFSLVIRLGYCVGISNYYFCMIAFQCFLFAVTGYLLYSAARLAAGVKMGLAVWLFYVFMVGFSPWVVIPYSDATGLLFPTLLFYLYARICREKQVTFCWFLMAFSGYVGYHIKPQVVIVCIAVFLVSVFSFEELWKKQKSHIVKNAFGAGAGLLLGAVLVAGGVRATHLEINEELSVGFPHFLMMGLNEEAGGVINLEDQNFSLGFESSAERTRANLQVAGERLQDLGITGLLKLWKNKLLTNFADGTFAWWKEGNFYHEQMYDGDIRLRGLLTAYFYEGGALYEAFKNNAQTLWMGTLLLALLSVFCKEDRRELDVLKLSAIGIIMFETIFEARARYLFTCTPLFVLLAFVGMYTIINKILPEKGKK